MARRPFRLPEAALAGDGAKDLLGFRLGAWHVFGREWTGFQLLLAGAATAGLAALAWSAVAFTRRLNQDR